MEVTIPIRIGGLKVFGLGKPSSKFGKFLRRNTITQTDFKEWSGVNQNTLSRISRSNEHKPSMSNGQKIIKALKKRIYSGF